MVLAGCDGRRQTFRRGRSPAPTPAHAHRMGSKSDGHARTRRRWPDTAEAATGPHLAGSHRSRQVSWLAGHRVALPSQLLDNARRFTARGSSTRTQWPWRASCIRSTCACRNTWRECPSIARQRSEGIRDRCTAGTGDATGLHHPKPCSPPTVAGAAPALACFMATLLHRHGAYECMRRHRRKTGRSRTQAAPASLFIPAGSHAATRPGTVDRSIVGQARGRPQLNDTI